MNALAGKCAAWSIHHRHIGMHNSAADTDGFHSIFSLWQLEGITSPCCLLIATHDLFGQKVNNLACSGEEQWNQLGQKSRLKHKAMQKQRAAASLDHLGLISWPESSAMKGFHVSSITAPTICSSICCTSYEHSLSPTDDLQLCVVKHCLSVSKSCTNRVTIKTEL